MLSAGYSGAFVARDCGDVGEGSERRYDFVLTHHEHLVTAVGRSFLQELVPVGALSTTGHQPASAREVQETTENDRRVPSRGALLRRYTRAR